MALVFREEKGSPLTIKEVDSNFRDLDERLLSLEKIGSPSEGIKEVILEGDEFVIKGTYGTALGRCRFPLLMFQPRGAWEEHTLYSVYDLIYKDSQVLCCIKNHTSSSFQENLSCWKVLIELPRLSLLQNSASSAKPSLPLYTEKTLAEGETGDLGLLLGEGEVDLIVKGPKEWIKVRTQEKVDLIASVDEKTLS